MGNPHVIGRQVLDLTFADEQDLVSIQAALGEVFRHQVIPAMETVFNQFSESDSVVRLERLEIDLGQIDFSRLEQSFCERICDALEYELSDALTQERHAVGQQFSSDQHILSLWNHVLGHGHLPWWAPPESASGLEQRVETVTESLSELPQEVKRTLREQPQAVRRLALQGSERLLNRILQLTDARFSDTCVTILEVTCRLLENCPASRVEAFKQRFLEAALKECLQPSDRSQEMRLENVLSQALQNSIDSNEIGAQDLHGDVTSFPQASSSQQSSLQPSAKQTLVRVVSKLASLGSDPHQRSVLETFSTDDTSRSRGTISRGTTLSGKVHPHDGPISEDSHQASPSSYDSKPFGATSVSELRSSDSISNSVTDRGGQAAHSVLQGADRNQPWANANLSRNTANALGKVELPPMDSPIESENLSVSPTPWFSGHSEPQSSTVKSAEVDDLRNNSDSVRFEQNREDGVVRSSVVQENDSIYVDDAGLILLHPFLRMHFEALRLCRENGFASEHSQQQAAHQLRFLATGEEDLPEYSLVLGKLLCGLAPEVAIAPMSTVQDSAKAEADELMNAVIRHWGALKNSTVDGLRESFLRREGILWYESDEWHLRVETRSYDLLLNRLPWPLSVVKLPWMRSKLRVQWK